NGLFGYLRGPDAVARARNYGTAPWWAPEDWRACLWRPVTAFTHWLDYRLYPDQPALMHAHNIAWYALAIFGVTPMYRRIGTDQTPGTRLQTSARSKLPPTMTVPPRSTQVAATLAAVLFLLDKDAFFPVMYVANRGFFIALVFGLLTLETHRRW